MGISEQLRNRSVCSSFGMEEAMIRESERGRERGRAQTGRPGRADVIYSDAFRGNRQSYLGGTAAPDDFWAETDREALHRKDPEGRIAARRQQQRVEQLNFRYVMFMGLLVVLMTVSLILYIKLQADISSSNAEIASLESNLTELQSSNDEIYNEISASIDLDEIRDKAINELGMKYASQDQIIEYSASSGGVVHQISEVEK